MAGTCCDRHLALYIDIAIRHIHDRHVLQRGCLLRSIPVKLRQYLYTVNPSCSLHKWHSVCPVCLVLSSYTCLQILALMVLRQRGMRLTIVSILEDLAVKLPPVRHHIGLVQKQFTQRFEHEDVMMRQITPPGFNAAEKVRLLPAAAAACVMHASEDTISVKGHDVIKGAQWAEGRAQCD